MALLLITETRPLRSRPLNIVVNFDSIEDIRMTTARGKSSADGFTKLKRDRLYASWRIQVYEQVCAFTEEQRHPQVCTICWGTKGLKD